MLRQPTLLATWAALLSSPRGVLIHGSFQKSRALINSKDLIARPPGKWTNNLPKQPHLVGFVFAAGYSWCFVPARQTLHWLVSCLGFRFCGVLRNVFPHLCRWHFTSNCDSHNQQQTCQQQWKYCSHWIETSTSGGEKKKEEGPWNNEQHRRTTK